MAVYSSSPSQDLTAAWYAAAPPPPPPQAKGPSKRASMAPQSTYSNHTDTLRTSSSSTSLSFDKRSMGDDLPRDSHSPAPERPVSRNAMAKQRERERQRARTNSTSGQIENGNYPSSQQSHHLHSIDTLPNRSPSPGPRNRRESSPAVAGQWSTYHPEQNAQQPVYNSQIGQSYHPAQQNGCGMAQPQISQAYPPPSAIVMQQPVPSYGGSVWAAPPPTSPSPGPQYCTPAPQQFVQQVPIQPPQPQQHYNGYPTGYVSAPQTPSQFAQGYWPQSNGQQPVFVAEPISMPQTPVYASTPVVNGQGHWIAQQQQSAPVTFPTSTVMPPPPVPVNQPVNGYGQIHSQQQGYPASAYGTPPTVNGRPLPSPSRTSSQSSSVGTRTSTTSLGSISGTVRRSLPQPPPLPQGRSDSNPQPILSGHTTVRQSDIPASLGRHESVRMAAEEIMSRGLPNRRKGLPSSMRTQSGTSSVHTHANSSRSDGSITDGTLPGTSAKPSTPVPVTPRNRAESASCLENEMRSMKLQDNNETRHASLRSQRTPFAPVQPSVNGHQHVSVPAPSTNEPIRASSPRPIRAAPSPDPEVTISSPMEDIIPRRPLSRGPKDERERRRSMEIQAAAAVAAKSAQVPSITVDDGPMIPTISFDDPAASQTTVPTIVMPGEEDNGPSIQMSEAPQICISEENEAEKPTGTISISVSSAGLAQRSTSSNNVQGQSSLPPRQRTASKPFAAPAPASAPSIGSGAACATCQKWIGGRVVHAMSHTFHPDCFVCSHCSEALEHVAFYEHEGRPYCHFDFHELFSKRCFHCRTPIVDQRYITINDVELVGNDGTGETQERCYHDMHFFCANCGDPFLDPKLASSAAGAESAAITTAEIEDEDGHVRFGGREFVVHKGYPYCEHCHVSLHKPKCKGCKKPIIDEEYLTALRGKWHIGCFCCERCQHPIDSDNFFVRDGQAYDEECYKIKLRSEL